MYAIIKSGGKQLKVEEEDIVDVELIDAEEGAKVKFDQVLFIGDGSHRHVGKPTVAGYVVEGEVLGEVKGPKIMSVKYKPSHNQWKKFGHRQRYHRVKITKIAKAA
jgi:large subunit ribosomal protein L21